MNKHRFAFVVLTSVGILISPISVFAQDFANARLIPGTITDSGGTATPTIDQSGNKQSDFYYACSTGFSASGYPPCPAGTTPKLFPGSNVTPLTSLPADALGIGSSVGINVSGYYLTSNPGSSNSNLIRLNTIIPLTAFASAADISALSFSIAELRGANTLLQSRLTSIASTADVSALNVSIGAIRSATSSLQSQLAVTNDSLSRLNIQVSEINSALQESNNSARRTNSALRAGIAMSASFDTGMPLDGAENRISFGTATFEDRSAFSVNYARTLGGFDAKVNAAFSDNKSLGRASVGFSW
jgi:YadA-like membrane anchor domain